MMTVTDGDISKDAKAGDSEDEDVNDSLLLSLSILHFHISSMTMIMMPGQLHQWQKQQAAWLTCSLGTISISEDDYYKE